MDNQDNTINDETEALIEDNTALGVQQRFYNNFGFNDQIVWDR